jgi:hypothetical protein
MLVLATLLMNAGCGESLVRTKLPPLATDLKEYRPFPQPTGDKGRDALNLAAALVQERALRRAAVNEYCEHADPC